MIAPVIEACRGFPDCAGLDDNRKHDAYAVQWLVLGWCLYPLFDLLARNRGNALLNDCAYAVLDVMSKGGLALYSAHRRG